MYYLPLGEGDAGKSILPFVRRDYLLEIALPQNGRPSEFREVARGRDTITGQIRAGGDNSVHVPIPITGDMAAARGCYLRFSDGSPETDPDAIIMEISIRGN